MLLSNKGIEAVVVTFFINRKLSMGEQICWVAACSLHLPIDCASQVQWYTFESW